jgi:hypothetical protein
MITFTGHSITETAAILKVHYRTVQRWVTWYRKGGTLEVLAHRGVGVGKTPLLTPEQQSVLRESVAQGLFPLLKTPWPGWSSRQKDSPKRLRGSLLKRSILIGSWDCSFKLPYCSGVNP